MNRQQTQAFVDALKKLRESLTDQQASIAAEVYPTVNYDGQLISAGTRINWKGTIKRAAVDLWDTEENSPDNAPPLWESLDYKEGYRIIPSTLTVGTAFAMNEYGWWGDVLYKSLIDNNIWTPAEYATGWEKI